MGEKNGEKNKRSRKKSNWAKNPVEGVTQPGVSAKRRPPRLATLVTCSLIFLVMVSSMAIALFAYASSSEVLRERAISSAQAALVNHERLLRNAVQARQKRAGEILAYYENVCSRDLGWSKDECLGSQLKNRVDEGSPMRALLNSRNANGGSTIAYGDDALRLSRYPRVRDKTRLALLNFDETPGRYMVEAESKEGNYIRLEFAISDLLTVVSTSGEADSPWLLAPDGHFVLPSEEPFKGAGKLAAGCADSPPRGEISPSGQDRRLYLSFRHLGFLDGACLATSANATDALAPATRLRNTAIGIALLLSAFSMPLALLASRKLTKPLAALTDQADQIRAGDLSGRSTPAGTVEMIALARSLNDMSAALDEAQNELRASQTRAVHRTIWLEALLDLLPTPLILVNADTQVHVFSNQAAVPTHSMFLEIDEGTLCRYCFDGDGNVLHAADLPQNRAMKGEVVRDAVMDCRTPVGTLSLIVSARTVPGIDGADNTLIISYLDVSALKNTQIELQKAIRSRDEFLTVASHELKTPLTTLQLRLQNLLFLIEGGGGKALPAHRLESMLRSTERETSRLVTLVHSLLDVSRSEIGKLSLNLKWMDLSDLVNNCATDMNDQFEHAGSSLRTQIPPEVRGFWDEARLEQVILNLLSNALKYGNGKPVQIEIEDQAQSAAIIVRDRGVGIEPENLSRIFQPYERANGARTASGLGLGLYISHQIVLAHKGRIEIQSTPGHGTTVSVILPKAAPDNGPKTADPGQVS